MTLVTASDLAYKLGVHVNTIYRLAQKGEIPVAFHVGPRIRFDLGAVLAVWPSKPKPLTRAGTPRRVRLSKGVDWELSPEQVDALDDEGYVYFIRAATGGPIKIGTAQNISRRMEELQRMSPFPLVLLASSRGGRQLEYRLHRKFAEIRVHGEWFKPTGELLAFVHDTARDGTRRSVEDRVAG